MGVLSMCLTLPNSEKHLERERDMAKPKAQDAAEALGLWVAKQVSNKYGRGFLGDYEEHNAGNIAMGHRQIAVYEDGSWLAVLRCNTYFEDVDKTGAGFYKTVILFGKSTDEAEVTRVCREAGVDPIDIVGFMDQAIDFANSD